MRHSPSGLRAGETLLELGKVVGIVVIAAVVGVIAGKGLSTLFGDSAESRPSAVVGAATTTTPAPAPIGVDVTFAGLRPLATATGEPAARSRLRVGVRLRNRSDRRVTIDVPHIQAGANVVRADVSPSGSLAGGVRRELPAGASARGELRFVVGAATARRLTSRRRTDMLIGGRRVSVRFEVGEPAADVEAGVEPAPATTTTIAP